MRPRLEATLYRMLPELELLLELEEEELLPEEPDEEELLELELEDELLLEEEVLDVPVEVVVVPLFP